MSTNKEENAIVTGLETANNPKEAEYDLVASLLAAADYRNDITTVDICRSCLLYTSPSPRDRTRSRMPSSA